MKKKSIYKLNKFINYIKLHFDTLSLNKKLISTYTLILLLPTIAFSIYTYNTFKFTLENDMYNNSQKFLLQAKYNVTSNIETMRSTTQSLVGNLKLISFLNESQNYTTYELLNFRLDTLSNFLSIQNSANSLFNIRIFSFNDNIKELPPFIYKPPITKNKLLNKKSWINKIGEQWMFNHPFESYNSTISEDRKIVSLYRTISGDDGKSIGIVETNMLTDRFFSIFKENHNGDDSFTCAIFGKQVIASDTKNRKNLFTELNKNTSKTDGNFILKNYYGTNYLVSYSLIDSSINLVLYHLVPLNKLNQELNKFLISIFVTALITLLLILLASFLITSVLLKKIKVIIELMNKVQKGDLCVNIPSLGKDEIGEIAIFFKNMMDKILELMSLVVRKQTIAKEAEIDALYSQINKHFIYNTLEAINMMAIVDKNFTLSNSVVALGRMMRYSMSWSNQYVTLEEELLHISNYISLINIRSLHDIKLELQIDDYILKFKIMKLLLQPIVENAYVHGLEPKNTSGTIIISSEIDLEFLFIHITDNGVGMSNELIDSLQNSNFQNSPIKTTSEKSNGIALKNIVERIKLFYGNEYGLEIKSNLGIFTRMSLKLPYSKEKELTKNA